MVKAKKTVYSPETRAAVLAALLEGQGTSKVAADFKLPWGTVRAWHSKMRQGASPMRHVATEKKDAIGALLVEYLHTNLETLRQQSLIARDPVWLKQQSAADFAVLHGVLTDKTIRLLEALSAGNETPPAAGS